MHQNLLEQLLKLQNVKMLNLMDYNYILKLLGRNSFKIKKNNFSINFTTRNYDPFQLKDINKYLICMRKLELKKKCTFKLEVEMIPEIDESISLEKWQKLVELWKKKIVNKHYLKLLNHMH